MSEKIAELLKLVEQLPKGLRSDWDCTNHYELTTSAEDGEEYFWLMCREFDGDCNTEEGKRLGLLLDIAVTLKEAEKELLAKGVESVNLKEARNDIKTSLCRTSSGNQSY